MNTLMKELMKGVLPAGLRNKFEEIKNLYLKAV